MKVFIVHSYVGADGDQSLCNVYATRELAEGYIAAQPRDKDVAYDIEEYDVISSESGSAV